MLLCEAANFDVVIVETVGVGQSETEVAHMVDCFISLQTAGGGDEIQGIKKGLMEMADLIVINKDDGDNRNQVAIARHMYESALHILRRKYDEWQPRVLTCSALEKRGIEEIWQAISDFQTRLTDSGRLEKTVSCRPWTGCKSRPKKKRYTCSLPTLTSNAISSKRCCQ